MVRRSRFLASVGIAVGLGLTGCQGQNLYSMSGGRTSEPVVRANGPEEQPDYTLPVELLPVEADEPAGRSHVEHAATSPSLQGTSSRDASGSASSAQPELDPFKPMSAKELLASPYADPVPEVHNPIQQTGAGMKPVPIEPTPLEPAPIHGASHMPAGPETVTQSSWTDGITSLGHSALSHVHGTSQGCPTCGAGPAGGFSSLLDNSVITLGGGAFRTSGGVDADTIFGILQSRNITLLSDIPQTDKDRVFGSIEVNSGIPLTSDGNIGVQLGASFTQAEFGAQTFFTGGFYRQCNPLGGLNLNLGAVYDGLYDDFTDIFAGQVRIQVGSAFTPHNEVGVFGNIATNVDEESLIIRTLDGSVPGGVFADAIVTRFKPVTYGYIYWRHIWGGMGAQTTLFVGLRGDPGDAFVWGGTAQVPLNDYWAIVGNGHSSDDDETYEGFVGLALFPGGKARIASSCGCRYLPYMDVANNTYLNVQAKPKFLRAQRFNDIPIP